MSASKQDTHADLRATDGPTDHESRDRLHSGQATYSERYAALSNAQEEASFHAEAASEELVALLDAPVDGQTPEAQERNVNAALAKMYAWANLAPGALSLQLMLGFLGLLIAGPIMLGIEFSMFFEAFKGLFQNEFGELTAAAQSRAIQFSLQAVIVVLAIKIWAVKAKRIEFLTIVAFLGAIGFVIGAMLKHANTLAASDATYAGGGFSWDALPSDVAIASTALFGTALTAPLLALGFLVVPIVSAVLVGWSWSQIKGALEGLAKARMFRRSYAADKKAQQASAKADRALANLETQEDDIVTAPLNELTNEHHANARHEKSRIKKQRRRARTNGRAGNSESSMDDVALTKAESAADETLKHLGNGFVKNQHAAWLAERKGSPP
ncbi:MAG: hypothetical protein AAF234_11505 [Pseudomonadota bacterium]